MTSLRRLRAHLKAAKAYSELSRAKRLQVGAVVVREDRVVSIGYNGTPSGGSNSCEDVISKEIVSPVDKLKSEVVLEYITRPEVLHAEENCIAFAAKNGIATKDCTLITTHSPCFNCCRLIIQAGIKEVWYETEYRDTNGLDLLKEHNVKVGVIHA